MKKIIRLTERDLSRIVKRVIRESDEENENSGFEQSSSKSAISKAKSFLSSIDNDGDGEYDDLDGTNDAVMKKTIFGIKDKSEFFSIDNIVKKMTGNNIVWWIKDENKFDSEERTELLCHLTYLGLEKTTGYSMDFCKTFESDKEPAEDDGFWG